MTPEEIEEVEFFADLWNEGTREDRLSMSHIPVTFSKDQFDYFAKLVTRLWCIHYFEGGFE